MTDSVNSPSHQASAQRAQTLVNAARKFIELKRDDTTSFSLIRRLVVRTRMIFTLLLILGFIILGAFSYIYTGYRNTREFNNNIELLGNSVAKSVEYFDLAGVDSIANAYFRILELDYLEILDAYGVSQVQTGLEKPNRPPDSSFVIRNESDDYLGETRVWRKMRFFAMSDILLQVTANVIALFAIVGVGTIWIQKLLRREVAEPISHLVNAIEDDTISIEFRHDECLEKRKELAAVTAVYRHIREKMREAIRERDFAITQQKLENMRRAEQVHLIEEALALANMSLSYHSDEGSKRAERFGADVPPEIEPFLKLRNFSESHVRKLAESKGLDIQHILFTSDALQPHKEISSCEIRLNAESVWRLRFMSFYINRKAIFATNISNERALEKLLHHKNKMEALGVVASGVAHDINNILAIISTAIEQLNEAQDIKKNEIIDIAISAVERGSKTVKQLLQFAHVKENITSHCHIDAICEKLEISLSHFLGPHIKLNIQKHATGHVAADSDYLESILFNLCLNARDSINSVLSSGKIDIVIRCAKETEIATQYLNLEQPYLAIDVMDNGAGIPVSIVDKIFDPFYSTKPVGSGTGLGLSMAYDYLNRAGGTIYIKDSGSGRTCFTILLCLRENVVESAEADPQFDTEVLKNLDILVVDDERNLGELMKTYLERLGMNVTLADSVTSATRALEAQTPDILLSDIHMPDGYGQALLFQALQKNKNTLGILMSGNIELDSGKSTQYAEEFEDIDIPFLYKPFKLNDLKSFLVKSVHQHRSTSLH